MIRIIRRHKKILPFGKKNDKRKTTINQQKQRNNNGNGGRGEMADAPDLGSGEVTRGGSSPSARTNRRYPANRNP